MNEFEKESQTMDMKEEMMGDAVDDVMDDEAEGEGEEEEGDKILKEVLDEIGINTSQMVSLAPAIGTVSKVRKLSSPVGSSVLSFSAGRDALEQPTSGLISDRSTTRCRRNRHGRGFGSRVCRRSTLRSFRRR
jgi:division protein CdvB (Snf7/Vps24/ESCRT-III family)